MCTDGDCMLDDGDGMCTDGDRMCTSMLTCFLGMFACMASAASGKLSVASNSGGGKCKPRQWQHHKSSTTLLQAHCFLSWVYAFALFSVQQLRWSLTKLFAEYLLLNVRCC